MIDYNKYHNIPARDVSSNRTISKATPLLVTKKIRKLNKENKQFLKSIGLLR